MKPSELFGVVVRSVGLLLTVLAMCVFFGAFASLVLRGPASVVGLLIIGIPQLLLGIWLLLGASNLAASLYSNESKKDQ